MRHNTNHVPICEKKLYFIALPDEDSKDIILGINESD